uniref:E3 ubiquitin-protein ligase n=1 Tax=Anoplophora glabripennis TaxID=217634 RepID=V5GWC6_ANOGL
MTLQVHPIALGCMLVVAVGTLIYTYMTTRQQAQEHSYGGSSRSRRDIYEDPPFGVSRSSSWSTIPDDREPPSRKKKRDICTICLSPLKWDMKTLTCSHVFHSHCITMWLNKKNTCPLCRTETHI